MKRAQSTALRRIGRWLLRTALAGVAAILILLVLVWIERNRPLELPAPTGSMVVGHTMYDWSDAPPTDGLARESVKKRELLASIWYPAKTPSAPPEFEEYLPAPVRMAMEGQRPAVINFLTRDMSKVRAHSLRDAEVSPQDRTYPVVILRAGASAGVGNYTTLAEDLASHGYVVVGFDVPYRTGLVVLPDGRAIYATPETNPELCLGKRRLEDRERCVNELLEGWTADIAFALDQLEQLNAPDSSGRFTGRLELSRVGILGHSLGGATALQFCHEDPRCKAGIDLDGAPHGSVILTGLHQPFLFLLSDHGAADDPESLQILANIQSIYDRLPPDGRLRFLIGGANHFTFSDDGALFKSYVFRGLLRLFGQLRISGRRQLAVTTHCIHTFFDAYLKGTVIKRLDLTNPLYPELEALE